MSVDATLKASMCLVVIAIGIAAYLIWKSGGLK